MRLVRIISPLTMFLLILAFIAGSSGCANIIPPEGGARDTLAPRALSIRPADSTRNFTERRITFNFDEYVEVQNAQQNLIVSPLPKTMPVVEAKLKTVTVRIRDTLEPNTTYALNFSKVIKDVNEGNEVKDFIYVFSTGSTIDSLELSGMVVLAENEKIDTTLTVMLHTSGDDSAVIKERPRYIARLDGQGMFHFRFLAPGTYYLYAMKDEGGAYRYMKRSQLFAFADSAMKLGGAPHAPVKLYAYSIPEPPKPASSQTNTRKDNSDRRLRYQTSIGGMQDLLSDVVFTFETPLKRFDSSKVRFTTDTLFTPVTSGYLWELDSTGKKLSFKFAWQENTAYAFLLDKDFATDTLGKELLKADTVKFVTKRKVDYGELRLRFRNLDLSSNPLLLFVQNNETKKAVPLTNENFYDPLFIPGEYDLRIVHDRNRNGKWDPGDFFHGRIQPEKVIPLSRIVNVKANWENEVEIDVRQASQPAGQAPGGRKPNTPGTTPGGKPRPQQTITDAPLQR
jgi:hypothetical protein